MLNWSFVGLLGLDGALFGGTSGSFVVKSHKGPGTSLCPAAVATIFQ